MSKVLFALFAVIQLGISAKVLAAGHEVVCQVLTDEQNDPANLHPTVMSPRAGSTDKRNHYTNGVYNYDVSVNKSSRTGTLEVSDSKTGTSVAKLILGVNGTNSIGDMVIPSLNINVTCGYKPEFDSSN